MNLMGESIVTNKGYKFVEPLYLYKNNAVYISKHIQSRKTYVIKKTRWTGSEYHSRCIERELQIWQPLRHANIVPLIEDFKQEYDNNQTIDYYRVMEFCEYDLKDWFYNNDVRTIETCVEMIKQIISGLCYLHSERKLHRDIKPDNIFIGERGVCKIADFDFIVDHIRTEVNAHTGNIGNRLYGAPEQFTEDADQTGAYNLKADIYPLGIILMEFFTIFDSVEKTERTDAIKKLRKDAQFSEKFFQTFDRNTSFYRQTQDLILLMTREDKSERPDIESIRDTFEKIST